MVEEDRKLAIVIGVAGSVPPKYLPGAINGAKAFEQWALQQGYETTLVTDAKDPVTMQVLREKIETLLTASPRPIYRIIVYFAGHGLIREISESLWLLSDWREELRSVAVEALKRRLSMYGPRQVCIISDACQSLPTNIQQADLVPDAVLGSGPKAVDLSVALDKFFATQDGEEAFMIPGADPQDDRCLFSGVLIEGLWGQEGLTQSPFSRLEPDKITGRSLGAYLAAEASQRARNYGLSLTPTISATFPDGFDDYFRKDGGLKPPTFPPWPPEGNLTAQTASAGTKVSVRVPTRDHAMRETYRPARPAPGPPRAGFGYEGLHLGIPELDDAPIEIKSTAVEQLRSQRLPGGPGQLYFSGMAVSGREVAGLWLGDGVGAKPLDVVGSWSVTEVGFDHVEHATPTFIEFVDGLFASSVVLPWLFSSLVRDDYGIAGVLYRDIYAGISQSIPTEEALKALESGTLRADAAADFATRLREGKHADPILGVISAYLYDAVGDVDNIRRMASFYALVNQAIPYDIALLGGLAVNKYSARGFEVQIPAIKARAPRTDVERTHDWTHCAVHACSGTVAGMWPWMRQGWTYLDHPSDVGSPLIIPGLVDLRSSLMRSRFTTFERAAGRAAASLIGLKPQRE
jgi:hypothetical protein